MSLESEEVALIQRNRVIREGGLMKRFKTWPILAIAAASLAVLTLGVGYGVAQEGTPGAGTPCPSAAAGTPEAAMVASPTACPAAGPTIDMIDINFTPKEVTIPANTDVTITLVNKGAIVHNFDIDELNVHSGDYSPGQTGTVTINAKPGSYKYYCNIPGHEAAGMVGTLTVQ
jgi:uncharacterized cupredoxin-like copper-binding protein